jgi:hypothetical protein
MHDTQAEFLEEVCRIQKDLAAPAVVSRVPKSPHALEATNVELDENHIHRPMHQHEHEENADLLLGQAHTSMAPDKRPV